MLRLRRPSRLRTTPVVFLLALSTLLTLSVTEPNPATAAQRRNPDPVLVTGDSLAWAPGSTYAGTFADPDIVTHNGRWYAYATNTANVRLPTLVSDNLTQWKPLSTLDGDPYEPLRGLGAWVLYPDGGGTLWAPGVAPMGEGWTVAYSAHESNRGPIRHNCIGLARGPAPVGPFTAVSDRPLLCGNRSALGVIDPDLYTDPQGRHWLLWKFSGIAGRRPADLMIRQLNSTGTGWMPGSRSIPLLTHQAGGWEGNTIENPSMITFGGRTYLFYSANAYRDANYATGYAICDTPTGPCRRAKRKPLLSTARTAPYGFTGPGGASAFTHDQTLRLIYHAWDAGQEGWLRRMHIATLKQKRSGRLVVKHVG